MRLVTDCYGESDWIEQVFQWESAYCILALFAQPVKLRPIIGELVAEVLDPFEGLLLLLLDELFLGEGRVVVNGPG